jgi:hypothetical protein
MSRNKEKKKTEKEKEREQERRVALRDDSGANFFVIN